MEQTKTPLQRPAVAPVARPVMDVARPAAPQQPAVATATAQSPAAPVASAVAMHQAPPQEGGDPKASTPLPLEKTKPAQRESHAQHHAISQQPLHHAPVGAVVLIIMGMIILSGLAILVYLNS